MTCNGMPYIDVGGTIFTEWLQPPTINWSSVVGQTTANVRIKPKNVGMPLFPAITAIVDGNGKKIFGGVVEQPNASIDTNGDLILDLQIVGFDGLYTKKQVIYDYPTHKNDFWMHLYNLLVKGGCINPNQNVNLLWPILNIQFNPGVVEFGIDSGSTPYLDAALDSLCLAAPGGPYKWRVGIGDWISTTELGPVVAQLIVSTAYDLPKAPYDIDLSKQQNQDCNIGSAITVKGWQVKPPAASKVIVLGANATVSSGGGSTERQTTTDLLSGATQRCFPLLGTTTSVRAVWGKKYGATG